MKNTPTLLILLLCLINNFIYCQEDIEKATFDTQKREILENDWFSPLITEKKNVLLVKYLEGFVEGYKTEQKGNFYYHEFVTYWRDNKTVHFTFKFDANRKILFIEILYPREGHLTIIDYFRASEKLKNENNLNFMLTRNDVDFGWYNMNNGLFYKLQEVNDSFGSIQITCSDYYGKGFSFENGK